jgi:hypothetical protein
MKMGRHHNGFVMGLSKSKTGNNTMWVIVDRLTKSILFLPIKMTDPVDKLTMIYVNKVVSFYGILISIVSDRDHQFTSRLWLSLENALGIRLNLSTANHP